jgi:excinuclease ABC subunit A
VPALKCEGYGNVIGIDRELVIPDRNLSVYDDGVAPWRGEKLSEWKDHFIRDCAQYDFPIHRSISELSEAQLDLLWKGGKGLAGLDRFFRYVEEKSYKIQYRVLASRYRGKTTCPVCDGTRLRPEARYVKVGGKDITELARLPIVDCLSFFQELRLSEQDHRIADRLLKEIRNRLQYLVDVGSRLLDLGTAQQHLEWRRDPTHRLSDLLGQQFGREHVHPGRAQHRPSPPGHLAFDRGVEETARPREYRDRGGAR